MLKTHHLLLGKIVTKRKTKGGLGVINLRMQNEVLLLKNLKKNTIRKTFLG
jgi:hypothetical protein